ncbi:hypothetical protein Pan181_29560 [Aeoliella mucimassa]|uniref:Uncharacterized protein n=1 Tax=Aeoliella mucimassa TaxID=2527972 RepID=A0A518APU8_9BACT|nr:hypothetical protein Pan181_29560 [Aeoliella mucimassa]
MASKRSRKQAKARHYKKHRRGLRRSSAPDYRDPYRPPKRACEVFCIRCGECYPSTQMKWDSNYTLWVCKNWPSCVGAGFGVDVHETTD